MADAAERKRAKEAYLKALEDQRQKTAAEAPAPAMSGAPQGMAAPGQQSAAQKREAQLEERRRKFFEGSSKRPEESANAGATTFQMRMEQPAHEAAIEFEPRRMQPKVPTLEAKEIIRPSDWKSKGFPSEFAYMKAMGQLDAPCKPLVDLSSWGAPGTTAGHPSTFAPTSFSAPSHGGGGFNAPSEEAKRAQPTDFSRSNYNDSSSASFLASQKPSFGGDMGAGGGLNFGALDDREAKKQKQAEYARALDQQATTLQQHQPQRNAGWSDNTAMVGGGGLNFGANEDKDAKRQKQADYARALDQQSYTQPPSNSQQHQQQQRTQQHQAQQQGEMAGGGGLIFGATDDKEARRQKQADYARALDQQSYTQAPSDSHNNHQQRPRTQHQAHQGEMAGGGGLNFGATDDKEARRQKQAEYARALDQQSYTQAPSDSHNHHQQQHRTQHNAQQQGEMAGGGGLNIGGGAQDKDAKRQKQAEYARALDQQSYMQAPSESHHHQQQQQHRTQHQAQQGVMAGGGGLNIGGGAQDKDAKRQKQAEYARALDQQAYTQAPSESHQHQQQHRTLHQAQQGEMAGGGGLNIGGGAQDKDAKRQKQAEYARALDQQAQQLVRMGDRALFGAGNEQNHRPQSHYDHGSASQGGAGLTGLGASPDAAKELKRQQQMDYTRQLNAQAQYAGAPKLNKFGEYVQPGRHHGAQQTQGGNAGAGDLSQIGGGTDGRDRAEKRTKQLEYAMALQQQQFTHAAPQQPHDRYTQQQVAAAAAPSGFKPGGGLEEGWVIGPMGLPVRKTLEVGNRRVQKAYADHALQAQSPKKHPSPGGGPSFGGYQQQQPYAQQGNTFLNSPPHMNGGMFGAQGYGAGTAMGGGGGAGAGMFDPAGAFTTQPPGTSGDAIGGDPDDRAARIKQQQAEQARVLKMQMQANEQRKAAEKEKLKQDELAEIQKWELHQRELKRAMEIEEQQKRQKIDEDNQRELKRQAEQKRTEKEQEAAKERETAAREEARVRAEQEVLRRKEEQELQREAEAAERERQFKLKQQQQQRALVSRDGTSKRANLFDQPTDSAPQQSWAAPPHAFQQQQQQFPAQDSAWQPASAAPITEAAHISPRGQNRSGSRGVPGAAPAANSNRDRSHLFGAADSNEDIFGRPASRGHLAPSSPHKHKVEQFLSNRVVDERQHWQRDQADDRPQEQPWAPAAEPVRGQSHGASRGLYDQNHDEREPVEEHMAHIPQPLMLNLSNLKSNISAGVVSARGASRGRSRAHAGAGPSGSAVAESPAVGRFEAAPAATQHAGSVARAVPSAPQFAPAESLWGAPVPVAAPQQLAQDQHHSGGQHEALRAQHAQHAQHGEFESLQQARQHHRTHAHDDDVNQQQPEYRDVVSHHAAVPRPAKVYPAPAENQYEPPADRLDFAMHSPSRTLKNDSKFMLPDGTFMQSISKPATPALTARWNQLSKQPAAQQLSIQSDFRTNSAGSSAAVASLLSPNQGHPGYDSRTDLLTPQSDGVRGLLDDFRGTLQLLQAGDNRAQQQHAPHRGQAQLDSVKRPSTSGSNASDFDLDRFNRRNERKWRVLQNIGGVDEQAEDDVLFRGMRDIHSRPSTAASVAPSNAAAVLKQHEASGGSSYSYGKQQQSGRSQGIAVSRPGSAEFARRLMQLNNVPSLGGGVSGGSGVPRAPVPGPGTTAGGAAGGGYGVRPRSGDRSHALQSGAVLVTGGRSSHHHHNASAGHGSTRYSQVAASMDDPDFDNYSDYGL
jgi:hypothetical protein